VGARRVAWERPPDRYPASVKAVTRVSALLPRSTLRAIDRARTRRFLAVTGPATDEYVRRYGLGVRHGPFTGMDYLEGLERTSGDLVAKLTGTYERELHGAVEEWIATGLQHVIDVGSAEGYYAIGFARAIPQATVHAFDIDSAARERCATMAERNHVGGRVRVAGACDPGSLDAFPERGVALLSDCEGAELALLDPERAPRLCGWPILVELHDFIDQAISRTICERFARTHEVEIIEGEGRERDVPSELSFTTARQRAALLSERRPEQMRWAHMRPRAPASSS
jgi:hypothetical protein